LFDEPTPLQVIEQVKPDILVKGDDYTVENIVGSDFVLAKGGEVKPFRW
jgi:bifunctional ADP-heptose synthase (sugar kinase/adenylyltransferase)